MGESCAKGAFDTHFHEANSSSVVRRCVQEPCGVCAERRLGERGIETEEEVVTVVKQVRLTNYLMPKAISTAEARPAPAATFLASHVASTTGTRSELLANIETSTEAMGEHGRNLMSATSNLFDLHLHCWLVFALMAFTM